MLYNFKILQGLDHVAENILSFLDARSLCAAELVSKEWNRVISEGNLKYFSRIHSKPINVQWIRTGSHPYEKIMSIIVLYPAFYEYKNVQS